MEVKLLYNNTGIKIDISEEELHKLESKAKKNGYEKTMEYYYVADNGCVRKGINGGSLADNYRYKHGNYYSEKIIAKHKQRKENLIRELERFSIKHQKFNINFSDYRQIKYYIWYDPEFNTICVGSTCKIKELGIIYFDTQKTAEKAIRVFKDELIWYFTKYKNNLEDFID